MKTLAALLLAFALACPVNPTAATGQTAQIPTDPVCTNGDCPVDPGCTDGGCNPYYKAGCCCGDPLPDERICCCKSDSVVTCRKTNADESEVLDAKFLTGQLPGTHKSAGCAPCWFPSRHYGAWWPEGSDCGWMSQLHKCAPQPECDGDADPRAHRNARTHTDGDGDEHDGTE